jgi:hypothetical protein
MLLRNFKNCCRREATTGVIPAKAGIQATEILRRNKNIQPTQTPGYPNSLITSV